MRKTFLYSFILCLLIPAQCQINSVVTNKYTSDQIELTNYDSEFWLISIGLGYPVQTFTVQVDSGSPYLWVPNTSCKSCQLTSKYNPSNQNDYQPTGATFSQQYGSGGECSGIVANDQVAVSTTPMNQTMTMAFATYTTQFPLSSQGFDGVMGLSNDQSILNIFQVAYTNKQISSQVYGLALNQMPTSSYLIYNTINSQILNNAVWMTSSSTTSWQTKILTMTVNGVSVYTYLGTVTSAVIVSGYSQLLVPENLYNYLMTQYFEPQGCVTQATTYIVCPCRPTNAATAPSLVVGFQGISVTIPYTSLLFDYYSSTAADTCQLAVASETSMTANVMGGPLFLSTIVLFNKATNQLGFYN